MPIRMVEDEPGRKRSSGPGRRSGRGFGGGGNGGFGNIIGYLIPLLFRNPKLLLIVLLVGGLLYFFMGNNSISGDGDQSINGYTRGGELNKDVYEETEIYEALADNRRNPLPEKVSLQKYCPTPMNQGQQGSCVAWASAYAARTILEAQRSGKNPNDVRFSPAFLFNQIKLNRNCEGSYIKYAMDNMYSVGAVPYNQFPYDDRTCAKEPDNTLKASAKSFKIRGFQRLTEDSRQNAKAYEVLAIKQNLAQGSPVIIGMQVGGTFMSQMNGAEVWIPRQDDYDMRGFGGHAMCIVGYDDFHNEGGAFLIMNSWGTAWGKNGFAWVRYTDFKYFNVESYGLYPMGNADKRDLEEFSGEFALKMSETSNYISLHKVSGNYFESLSIVPKNKKFKVEFTNNVECYTYIFGSESDESSYTLFPYTKLHSPFCGITGTRLFPSDYSMIADDSGTKDKFAVVVSSEPLDYVEYNNRINKSGQLEFEDKIASVFENKSSKDIRFVENKTVKFSTRNTQNKLVYFIIGIKK